MNIKRLRSGAPVLVLSLLVATGCSSTDSTETTTTETASASATASTEAGAETTEEASATGTSTATVEAAVAAATSFLDSLDADTKAAAMFAYDDLAGKEASWSNFPVGIFNDRQGARLGDLTDEQRTAALAVVDSLLSDQGMTQVTEILASDDYLGESQGDENWTSDNYYLAFYGDPATDTAWTMQFGGHHLAVHISVGGDTISVSPLFTGVEPTTFTYEGTEYSPMVEESDAVFGFLGSLDNDQLAAAELAGEYDDLVMGPGADTGYPEEAEGIAYADLTAEQQAAVLEIIGLWVGDADEAISAELLATYESQLADTYIGWAGSTDVNAYNAYLRIDGPQVWLEWLNAAGPGSDVPHYHTVYRDKTLDYGTGTA